MKLFPAELELFESERTDYSRLLAKIRTHTGTDDSDFSVTCIGNAGGSDAVSRGMPTGGLLIRYRDRSIVIDPGENSLAYLNRQGFNPYSVTDVIATHAHNDHVGDLTAFASSALKLNLGNADDVNILVPPTLIDYQNTSATQYGFTLPAYAWEGHVQALFWKNTDIQRSDGRKIQSVRSARVGSKIEVRSVEGRHAEIPVGGLIFTTPLGTFSYTADTEYFPGLIEYYQGSDVLWMNMSTLGLGSRTDGDISATKNSEPIVNHLGYYGVCKLIEEVGPRTAIVSHFGSHLLPFINEIQTVLRNRFAELGIDIYCTHSGDRFRFSGSLAGQAVLDSLES